MNSAVQLLEGTVPNANIWGPKCSKRCLLAGDENVPQRLLDMEEAVYQQVLYFSSSGLGSSEVYCGLGIQTSCYCGNIVAYKMKIWFVYDV